MAVAIVPWTSTGIAARRHSLRSSGPGDDRAASASRTSEPWLGVHTHFSLAPRRCPHEAAHAVTGEQLIARASARARDQLRGDGRAVHGARRATASCRGGRAARRASRARRRCARAATRSTRRSPRRWPRPCCCRRSAASAVTWSRSSLDRAADDPKRCSPIGGAPRASPTVAASGRGATSARRRSARRPPPPATRARRARPARSRAPRRAGDRSRARTASRGRRCARACRPGRRAGRRDESRRRPCTTRTDGRSRRARSCALPGLATVLAEWVDCGAGCSTGRSATRSSRPCGRVAACSTATTSSCATAEWTPCAATRRRGRTLVGDAGADARARRCSTRLDARGRPTAGDRRRTAPCWRRSPATRDELARSERARRWSAPPTATARWSSSSTATRIPRFGSGIVVADYDLVLANRAGRGFTPEPGHPNFPDRGRRPATTLHAWVGDATAPARRASSGGTPGGANQMPWNAQTLARARLPDGSRRAMLVDGAAVGVAARRRRRAHRGGVRRRRRRRAAARSRRALSPRRAWGCKCAQQVVRVPRAGEAGRRRRRPAHQSALGDSSV